MSRKTLVLIAGAACLAIVFCNVGNACPSCYGDPEAPMTDGMNMAIMSLLGFTGSVLVGVVGFFMYLRRRFRQLNQRFANRLN